MAQVAISINADLDSVSGSKHIYPPTFAGMGHNYVGLDTRSGTAEKVQVDTVGSFANRIEVKLAELGILPVITTHVGHRTLSIHDLPHRAYDAILRDSVLDGVPWRQSEIGQQVLSADAANATALYEHAPLTLLLGGWDSHGGSAGSGTKIARSVACEIWGHGVRLAKHPTQRVDPLDIGLSSAPHLIVDGILTEVPENGKKPSELGHGDVPDVAEKGVFVDRIEMSGAIQLMRLNRYHFPDAAGEIIPQRDAAARNVLVQLGQLGILLVLDSLDLRSGCELYTTSRTLEKVMSDGVREPFLANVDEVRANLDAAISEAERLGLKFAGPVQLTAGEALMKLAAKGEV